MCDALNNHGYPAIPHGQLHTAYFVAVSKMDNTSSRQTSTDIVVKGFENDVHRSVSRPSSSKSDAEAVYTNEQNESPYSSTKTKAIKSSRERSITYTPRTYFVAVSKMDNTSSRQTSTDIVVKGFENDIHRSVSRPSSSKSDAEAVYTNDLNKSPYSSTKIKARKSSRERSLTYTPRCINQCRGDRVHSQHYSRPSTELKASVTILKSYSVLKEELQKNEVTTMVTELFPGDKKFESAIRSAHKRREVVDVFLKRVLKDNRHACLITLLKKRGYRTIKSDEQVTDSDILAYQSLYEVAQSQRISRKKTVQYETLKFSKNDYNTLKDFLKQDEYLEKMNDQLLSRFIFTIEQHAQITPVAMEKETKVMRLLDMMQLFDENIYDKVRDILISIGLENVLRNLEREKLFAKQKRKRCDMSDTESETETSGNRKRQCLNKPLERKVAAVHNKPESPIKETFKNKLEMEIEKVEIGSIVVQFRAKGPNSWENLQQFCKKGEISELIKQIFDVEELYDLLTDGDFNMTLDIYKLSEDKVFADARKGMLVLKNTDEIPYKEKKKKTASNPTCAISDDPVSNLLMEELDVTDRLLIFLKHNHLVSSDITGQLSKRIKRKEKIEYILQEVQQHGQKGYEKLKAYIGSIDNYTYMKLIEAEKLVDVNKCMQTLPSEAREKTTKQSQRQKKFFSCGIVLRVLKSEIEKQVHISCQEMYNTVCYFERKDDESLYDLQDVALDRELSFDKVRPLTDSIKEKKRSNVEDDDANADSAYKNTSSPDVMSNEAHTKKKKISSVETDEQTLEAAKVRRSSLRSRRK